jgi:hypothetical protein
MRAAIVIALCAGSIVADRVRDAPRYVVPSVPVPPRTRNPRQRRPSFSRRSRATRSHVKAGGRLRRCAVGHPRVAAHWPNPTIAEAEARVREARALLRQDRAQYFPLVSGTTSVTKSAGGTDFRRRQAAPSRTTAWALVPHGSPTSGREFAARWLPGARRRKPPLAISRMRV